MAEQNHLAYYCKQHLTAATLHRNLCSIKNKIEAKITVTSKELAVSIENGDGAIAHRLVDELLLLKEKGNHVQIAINTNGESLAEIEAQLQRRFQNQ